MVGSPVSINTARGKNDLNSIKTGTKESEFYIHGSMYGVLIPQNETGELLKPDINHNTLKEGLVGEVLNRILGNPLQVDLNDHPGKDVTTDKMQGFIFSFTPGGMDKSKVSWTIVLYFLIFVWGYLQFVIIPYRLINDLTVAFKLYVEEYQQRSQAKSTQILYHRD